MSADARDSSVIDVRTAMMAVATATRPKSSGVSILAKMSVFSKPRLATTNRLTPIQAAPMAIEFFDKGSAVRAPIATIFNARSLTDDFQCALEDVRRNLEIEWTGPKRSLRARSLAVSHDVRIVRTGRRRDRVVVGMHVV